MTYTQVTITPKETHTREITELKLNNLLAQVIILMQAGEGIEFKRVYSPDYRHLWRYEMTRKCKDHAVTTYFIPSDTENAWAI